MSVTGPLLSWGIVLGLVGVFWFLSRPKQAKQAVATARATTEKAKPIFVGSTAEADEKKSKKKKKKTAKPATTPKEVVATTDDAPSDDDLAEEVNLKDVARRMQSQKVTGVGSGKKNASGHSPFATASTSGADADIDEEESTPLTGSSRDPSDMLEAPTDGPGVLRIGAPVQPPRSKKQKAQSTTSEPGIHASKNAKKKEKKKAEKEAARADQKSRFEQHRQSMRAEQAAAEKARPAPETSSSSWSAGKPSGSSESTPVNSTLLDTFAPQEPRGLGESWEAIPPHVQEPEPEWNEVQSRKSRKTKADAKSSDEQEASMPPPRSISPAIKPLPKPQLPQPQIPKKQPSKAKSEQRTTSGSDWSQVDNIEAWAVHPDESDF
ncbi:hypothetical protein EX30DRAFT_396974 [Ascodesmis nigricans]|uniref:Uncharacterized protein n=1 Tax=Ascodesmis nigricans TaxID=341454 RepID=A0A4S2MT35_9PEZI|nr:hypothetical protein EX30DRAFT_396974 [Ascodesmis nigricans]